MGALFLCLLFFGIEVSAKQCEQPSAKQISEMELAAVKRVVDGDTLHLKDGRKVRLIGVNTPEFGKKNKPSEPYAKQAAQRLALLVGTPALVRLMEGEEAKDRYGRLLAYAFTPQGDSIEAALIREGLGFAIAIPPNIAYQDCLLQAQLAARSSKLGVWGDHYFSPRSSRKLKRSDTGFRLVSGRLERARLKEGKTWWLLFEGRLALMIPKASQKYFDQKRLQTLVGRELIVSGWLIKKNLSAKEKAKKYKPYMMSVKHPAAFIDPVL
ncbi:thermonuclease family protein [Alkalimarinus alittae]|uniref:Thermonuclease family protein n=1 Tax=Alkalimarinus alittae TaxID=2961619 RepID=A0ABY6N141_9ALTE|nr:thermonuclease family protein [Alkalimarinus alittae]UZE95732.1 thermonuclease family protein [Alkalimarinus alittae]